MSPLVGIPLLAIAAVGHFALALFLFNRLHSQAWEYRLRQGVERILFFVTLAAPVAVVLHWLEWWPTDKMLREANASIGWIYLGVCVLSAVLIMPLWLLPKMRYRLPAELATNDTRVVDLQSIGRPTVCGAFPRLCAALPGNEVFQMHVQTKTFRLPRWPKELAGLRIAHLTDLHLTGRIGKEFYAEVARLTNALEPDLIALTGDIAEKPECLKWIQPLFSELKAPAGKFFILGNHDFLLDEPRGMLDFFRRGVGMKSAYDSEEDSAGLRTELRRAGFVDLGGRCEQIEIAGVPLLLAGNELPWSGPAPEVPPRDDVFRILLAHTPDLFSWAQRQQFDLMLAGHNHGGQICLPLLGPLVSPSKYGVRYAAGIFRSGPTLLHVGRGISGEHLLRWNCPPELTLLVLE
jgi:uncharacterized protein